MKEHDILQQLKEQTDTLPIPDSLSPEQMKLLLDSHKESQPPVSKSPRIRRYVIAASLALCFVGCAGTVLLQNQTSGRQTDSIGSGSGTTEAAAAESDSDSSDTEYAATGKLVNPKSYEAYYDALQSAYEKYYDSISQVEVLTDTATDSAVSKNSARESAVAESAENTDAAADSYQSAKGSYSTTNTQEEGIDEADVVKTDGSYIYRLTRHYDRELLETQYRLYIVSAADGSLQTVSGLNLNTLLKDTLDPETSALEFQEFYLYHSTLVLLFHANAYEADGADAATTYIVLCDVSDPAHPVRTNVLTQSGIYNSSRIADGYLYTDSVISSLNLDSRKNYNGYIPQVNGTQLACEDLYYANDVVADASHVLTSLRLEQPDDFTDSKAFPTRGWESYVSDSAIYLYYTMYGDITRTGITRIQYDEGHFTVGNTATVTGYLYGSFALNESDGYLRILATIPQNNISLLRSIAEDLSSANQTTVLQDVNALYILDASMELTGKLTGIAPGEQIYSARFIGDTGYFVTYRNTDPLFSVDLSDPTNPTIIGSLKLPGFSTYLHPYSNHLLLGLGTETDPKTQETLGLKLSMFDISDPSDVTEINKYVLDDGYYSYAFQDHNALMIDTVKNVFGFVFCDSEWNTYYVTYTYTAKNGFEETARYPLAADAGDADVRGVYIGNYFYLATDKDITSYLLGDDKLLDQVRFSENDITDAIGS